MGFNGEKIHVGIASHCDLYALKNYLFDEYQGAIVSTANYATAVTNLVKGLLDSGVKITLFTLSTSLSECCLKGKNLNIYVVPSYTSYPGKYVWGCWINAFRLKRIISLNINDIDLLHAHWTYEYAWASGKFTNVLPVVCSVRDIAAYIWKTESLKNKITWTFKVWMNFKVFNNKKINFVSNSEYTAKEVFKTWKINTIVIPNSVKEEFLNERNVENTEQFNLVSIAQNVDKRKNIIPLLQAYQKFKQGKNTSLWLVGGVFTASNSIMKSWKALGLLEDVVLMGSLDNIKLIEILDQCALMVHPSLEETFGNTLIEAMARKIPVIGGSSSGAVPYVLGQGKFGILADVSSSEDIKQKIELIYTNKNFANEIVQKAYLEIKCSYTINVVVAKHISLYNNLLN